MRASSLNCGDAYIIAYDHPDSLRPPFLVCFFASVLQAASPQGIAQANFANAGTKNSGAARIIAAVSDALLC